MFFVGEGLIFSHQGGHLYKVGTYTMWALIQGGHLYKVGTYTRWALIQGGHSFVVGRYSNKYSTTTT